MQIPQIACIKVIPEKINEINLFVPSVSSSPVSDTHISSWGIGEITWDRFINAQASALRQREDTNWKKNGIPAVNPAGVERLPFLLGPDHLPSV
jgi:hypothetical protein